MITSRYVDESGNGELGGTWRREVFFTLVDQVKTKTPKALKDSEQAVKYGTIECRVYRAERTFEPVDETRTAEFISPPLEIYKGCLKGRHISHASRLGAKIEIPQRRRYSVRSLDAEDSPFAWFKFHYRSRGYLEKKFKLRAFPAPPYTPSELYRQLMKRCSDFWVDISGVDGPVRAQEVHSDSEPGSRVDTLDATIQELEEELVTAQEAGMQDAEQFVRLREQIRKLRENSEKLRANSRALPIAHDGLSDMEVDHDTA
jgi:hypothetical protein